MCVKAECAAGRSMRLCVCGCVCVCVCVSHRFSTVAAAPVPPPHPLSVCVCWALWGLNARTCSTLHPYKYYLRPRVRVTHTHTHTERERHAILLSLLQQTCDQIQALAEGNEASVSLRRVCGVHVCRTDGGWGAGNDGRPAIVWEHRLDDYIPVYDLATRRRVIEDNGRLITRTGVVQVRVAWCTSTHTHTGARTTGTGVLLVRHARTHIHTQTPKGCPCPVNKKLVRACVYACVYVCVCRL